MQARSSTIKIKSGKVICWKPNAADKTVSCHESINGNKAVISIIIIIIMQKANIKYLNFNGNTPVKGMIEERLSYVNDAGYSGGWNE
jgi:hypothetical protein